MSLANILISKRREKGVTQEELAAHVGVSKGSVSKWERGNTFPDIMLLPVIAEYFGITIDHLMSHSPQLTKAEAAKIYTRLAKNFATNPFEEVIAECETLVKRYYSCHSFLLYIALLYLNHAAMAADDGRKTEVIQFAITLCEHVSANCRDTELLREASQFMAMLYLSIGNAEKTLEILADDNQHPMQHDDRLIISQAHQLLGNMEKATEVEQIGIFQSLMDIFNDLLLYIRLNLNNYEVAHPAFIRAEKLSELFNMRRLNANNAGILYALGSQMYQNAGNTEKVLENLTKYVDVCLNGFFPFTLKGDDFFSKIDKWLAPQAKNAPLPRNEAVVKESMLNDVLLIPEFENLYENPEFKRLVQKLKNFIRTG
jgi:transcriptional regulator with XRE-family HTH domain